MKKILCLALLGLAAALPAAAADPESIERPTARTGVSWRFVVTDGMTKALISDKTYTIAAVTDAEVVVNNDAGEEAFLLDAAHYAVKRAHGNSFEPPLQRLHFPLTIGSRWESAYKYNNPQCGPTDSKLSFKVAGWDDLATPAGKFRAMRIESEGRWRSGCGADRQTHKQWVTPDLPVPLKQESIVYFQGRIFSYEVHELQSLTRP